jgi:ADP-ribose pyrophosphatase YjhB (NUDIX family)
MAERVLVWLLFAREGAFLLARRREDEPPFAGQWVLPGDVMPEEESASETLARVAKDELDVRVRDEEFVDTIYLEERDVRFATNVFRVPAFAGQLRFRESGPYADVRWAGRSDLDDLSVPMPDALRSLLRSEAGAN